MRKLPVNPAQFIPTEVVLTRAMIEMLPMVIRGETVYEIAEKLGITFGAVKKRITGLLLCFGVSNRVELFNLAVTVGLHFKNTQGIQCSYALSVTVETRQ